MMFIKYVCRVPLRMSDADCLIGDDSIHGESAYTFGDSVDMSTLQSLSGVRPHDEEMGESGSPGEMARSPVGGSSLEHNNGKKLNKEA
jgi:hypothetical protein